MLKCFHDDNNKDTSNKRKLISFADDQLGFMAIQIMTDNKD